MAMVSAPSDSPLCPRSATNTAADVSAGVKLQVVRYRRRARAPVEPCDTAPRIREQDYPTGHVHTAECRARHLRRRVQDTTLCVALPTIHAALGVVTVADEDDCAVTRNELAGASTATSVSTSACASQRNATSKGANLMTWRMAVSSPIQGHLHGHLLDIGRRSSGDADAVRRGLRPAVKSTKKSDRNSQLGYRW